MGAFCFRREKSTHGLHMECAWMQVYKRGAPPGGGGEVQLSVPVARSLPPISLTEEGAGCTLSSPARTT